LNEYIRGDELKRLQEAQRRVLKTWDQVKDNPPSDLGSKFTMGVRYPPNDVTMAGGYRHPELIRFAKRYLKTEHIHIHVGQLLARYPGFVPGDTGHIDNGNNSLLPMSETAREYGTIGFWTHLEEVGLDQAPLLLGRKRDGHDTSKATP